MKHLEMSRMHAHRAAAAGRSHCALAVSMVFSASALAATVTKSGTMLTYNAVSGETNNVTVSDNGTTLSLASTGANISTFSGGTCTKVNNQLLTCPLTSISRVWVNAGNQNDTASSTSTVNFTVYGGDGNDTASALGNSIGMNNVLRGDAGNDTLRGGPAFETILGGDGTDYIDGGLGRDYLYGQAGVDTLDYSSRTADVFVDLDGVTNGIGSWEDDDNIDNSFEWVKTGAGNDTVLGGAQGVQQKVWAGAGHDSVTAGSTPLLAFGNDGNDTLVGGAANDELYGNNGDDALNGMGSGDLLSGQAGNDVIAGSLEGDSVWGGADYDTLTYEALALDISLNLLDAVAYDLGESGAADELREPDVETYITGAGADQINVAGDGRSVHVICGAGADTVTKDAGDTTTNCETVN